MEPVPQYNSLPYFLNSKKFWSESIPLFFCYRNPNLQWITGSGRRRDMEISKGGDAVRKGNPTGDENRSAGDREVAAEIEISLESTVIGHTHQMVSSGNQFSLFNSMRHEKYAFF